MDTVNGDAKVESLICMWSIDQEGRMKKDKEVRFCPLGKYSNDCED